MAETTFNRLYQLLWDIRRRAEELKDDDLCQKADLAVQLLHNYSSEKASKPN